MQNFSEKIYSLLFVLIAVVLEIGVGFAIKYSVYNGDLAETITFSVIALVPPVIFLGYLVFLFKELIKRYKLEKLIDILQTNFVYLLIMGIALAFEICGIYITFTSNNLGGVFIGIIYSIFPLPIIITISKDIFLKIKILLIGSDPRYFEYIKSSKTSLGRFTRPVLSDRRKIILANKYTIIDFDIISFSEREGRVYITDKQNGSVYEIYFSKQNKSQRMISIFREICEIFDYEIVAKDVLKTIRNKNYKLNQKTKETRNKKLYLDINQASEAELTAIPGVTIAKAKRAIKMRKKYAFYLSVNQFYEAINLEEQFIEQITSKGTKILLNNLPEYKHLEMKRGNS